MHAVATSRAAVLLSHAIASQIPHRGIQTFYSRRSSQALYLVVDWPTAVLVLSTISRILSPRP